MNAAYQQLPVADLKPGMVLSDEILDAQGQVLLARGARLTERSIGQLRERGIDVVAIVGKLAPPVDAASVLARLDHLFRRNDADDADDWATGLLRRYVTDYRLHREIDQ